MALANCKNTEITAHFRYARKFLLHYRYDAHKPLRERQNAGFFTASLVLHSHELSVKHWRKNRQAVIKPPSSWLMIYAPMSRMSGYAIWWGRLWKPMKNVPNDRGA
jgi:hypothetical protein